MKPLLNMGYVNSRVISLIRRLKLDESGLKYEYGIVLHIQLYI